jgi:hypothetical protein
VTAAATLTSHCLLREVNAQRIGAPLVLTY